MGDTFKEQIIKRQSTPKDTALKVLLVVASICIVFLIFTFIPFPFISSALVMVVLFGAWYLFSFLNVEYEYAFTNGELDIDCIYRRSRRKRVFSGEVKQFEIMTHVLDKDHESEFRVVQEKKDYSSGKINDNVYMFLATYKSKKQKIIIEPNDVLLQAIATVLPPRKLIKKK